MTPKEELLQLQQSINRTDGQLIDLFLSRMTICDRIADVKAAGNLAISNERREQEIINAVFGSEKVPENAKMEVAAYMRCIMALSKVRQTTKLLPANDLFFPASDAKPAKAAAELLIGYQGVEGAWGEHSAMQLFSGSPRKQYEYFDDVFDAVKAKEVDFGIVPIENTQSGAIGEVYDLLRRHSCYIVGQVWVSIAHCLLGVPGAAMQNVREVFSHPEGFRQCHRFLKNKHWELTVSRNTAVAAQHIAEKKEFRNAAIGSRRAAKKYGLELLAPDIMDNPKNKTRFIAIAEQPIYDATSNITSITFSTADRSGALCSVLQVFMLAGINLSRIESRPAGHNRYRFFADLEANVLDEVTASTLRQVAAECEYFEILGCYKTTEEDRTLYDQET